MFIANSIKKIIVADQIIDLFAYNNAIVCKYYLISNNNFLVNGNGSGGRAITLKDGELNILIFQCFSLIAQS